MQNRRAGWPPGLQFTWDLLGDPTRFRRALFAVALLGLVCVAIGYQATLHAATWTRFAATAGAIVIVSVGGGLVRLHRRRRRHAARPAGQRPAAGPPPAQVLPPAAPRPLRVASPDRDGGDPDPGHA
jgi:hypothetical protein